VLPRHVNGRPTSAYTPVLTKRTMLRALVGPPVAIRHRLGDVRGADVDAGDTDVIAVHQAITDD
jgi:hypothetical protein